MFLHVSVSHSVHRGVPGPGGSAPGGCLLLGGCLVPGVSAPGGVPGPRGCLLLAGRGVCSWGGVCSRRDLLGGVPGGDPSGRLLLQVECQTVQNTYPLFKHALYDCENCYYLELALRIVGDIDDVFEEIVFGHIFLVEDLGKCKLGFLMLNTVGCHKHSSGLKFHRRYCLRQCKNLPIVQELKKLPEKNYQQ